MGEYNILFVDKRRHEYNNLITLLKYVAGEGTVSTAKTRDHAEKILLDGRRSGMVYHVVSSGLVFEKREDGFEILKLAAELNPKCILMIHTAADPAEVEEKARKYEIRAVVLLRKQEVHEPGFAQAVHDLLGNGKVFGSVPTGLEARRDILELKNTLVNLTPKYAHGEVTGNAGKVKV